MGSLQFTEGSEQAPLAIRSNRQLLPNLYDGMAHARPEALYAIIPNNPTSYDAGYRKVTFKQLANAVNGVAWLLAKELGHGKTSETLTYVGANDIGYIVVILGAVKAGYSVLAVSARNTKADHASLFAATKCKTVLTQPAPYSSTVGVIMEALPEQPRVVHVPNLYEMLDGEWHPHFPYPKTFETAQHEPVVIVHTSGTTSTPKPVVYTHAFANRCLDWTQTPPPEGYENLTASFQTERSFLTIPFFYSGTIAPALWGAPAHQTTVVVPLGGVPPSVSVIAEGVKLTTPDAIILPAPFMEQIAHDPAMLDLFTSRIRTVGFGGGDISQAAGDAWAARVSVVNFNGSTETTAYPTIRRANSPEDAAEWKYIQPHPCVNLTFQPTAEPDLFEGVLVRNSDPSQVQPIFTTNPHLNEWRTHDLWTPHPSKPGLWRFRSRRDDMINSATGELCNPLPMEQDVAQHAAVAAALMVGTGRYQKALLIEPAQGAARDDVIQQVWPTIEAANQQYHEVSRIARTHILLTDPDQPLLRATKETVQRAPSLQLYQDRIDRLYEIAGDGENKNIRPYKVHVS